jgi:hypothetical protein
LALTVPQSEQVFEEGKKRSAATSREPADQDVL